MIRAVLALSIFATAIAAPAQEGLPRILKPKFITATTTFTPGAALEELETKVLTRVEVSTVESGVRNGVSYRIFYTDGSGTFAGTPDDPTRAFRSLSDQWGVACKKDAMDDSRYCYLKREGLRVFAYANGDRAVAIVGDHYPNTTAAVRVDASPPIRTSSGSDGSFGPNNSRVIIGQMMQGQKVTTRYVDWPYRSNVDHEISLYGFNEAYAYLEWALIHSN